MKPVKEKQIWTNKNDKRQVVVHAIVRGVVSYQNRASGRNGTAALARFVRRFEPTNAVVWKVRVPKRRGFTKGTVIGKATF